MPTIDTKHLCYNCFRELESGEGPCPYCGFDLQENQRKYPIALPAGTVLDGRYIIGRVLGQGGFGITYLAYDTQLGAKVAIKEFMPSEIATRLGTTVSVVAEEKSENFAYGAERFQEEAHTLAKFIGNPNIAAVTSYFDQNDTSYFVMDYIEGISFKTYIANHGGKVSVEDALNVMIPVLRALTAVHQEGFIHRDVTPDNIYITKDGQVKLLDFGSARYSIGDKSKSLDVILKVGYAPKEQYIRRSRQGPYTDVYSCAACFYAAITGFLPPESLERLDHDELVPISQCGIEIPEYLDKAILKGLAVQPEDRFQNAQEFLDAIESRQVVEVPGAAPPPPPTGVERLAEGFKKRPLLYGGAAAGIVVVLVLALSLFLTGGGGGGIGGGGDNRPLLPSPVDSITIAGQTYSTTERELELGGMGLTDADVQDIQYMVNLDYLDLSGNDITDLSFLSDLTLLRNLRLDGGNNNLTDLSPLADVTSLRSLQLPAEGSISDISPLAGLSDLESLWFNGNWNTPGLITDLSPLSGLTKLTNLGIKVGSGVDYSALSKLTSIQEMNLYGDLTSLDAGDLSGMTHLTRLYLSSLDGTTGFSAKDLTALSGLTNLQELNIDVNGLESLKGLEGMANLTTLQIYGEHNLKDISALGSLTKLQNLQISGSGTGELKTLEGLEGLTGLRELRLYVDGLESLDGIQGATGLTSLEINGENYAFTDLSPLGPLTKLQTLRLQSYGNTSGTYVEDLGGLRGMSELKELNLNLDGIGSLTGMEGLTSLTTCYISGADGTISLEPLRGLTKLQELSISGSGSDARTTDLSPLSGLTNLRSLSVSVDVNSLEGLESLTGLQTLSVSTDGLASLKGVENLTQLRELSISGSGATYTDVDPLANLTSLQILRLPNTDYNQNVVVDISGLAGLTSLQDLDIYGKVESLAPLSGLTSLKALDYSGSYSYEEAGVSLAPLSSLTSLTELYLSCNVPGNDLTPLSGLTQLRSLRLYLGNYRNPVQSLEPLRNLTNLTELTVSNTADGIDTSPVAHVPSLDIY